MIPMRFINQWRENAPWQTDAMVEQDLVISRAITAIFSDDYLADSLAFRGGTALNKLYFSPATRYSEDIDLVQIRSEPIGKTFNKLRNVLDHWLGTPRRKLKDGRANLYYQYPLEFNSQVKMRLKIEINTREHFFILEKHNVPFQLKNTWFSASANVTSYQFNELIGTKLRALYQRSKSRDLFDIWLATQYPSFDTKQMLKTFNQYMAFSDAKVSRAQFEENLLYKMQDPIFINDISVLLSKTSKWDIHQAYNVIQNEIIACIPGEPWKGRAALEPVKPDTASSLSA